MIELLNFINTLITLYVYIIIAGAVMSWLIAFNVVNPYNQFVRSIWQGLNALTEPLLRPIRRWMPDLGGIDISPVVLIIACWFVQGVVLAQPGEAARVTPPSPRPWRSGPAGIKVLVRVSPKSTREGVEGMVETAQGGALTVRVRAVAEKGEANRAVERVIAEWIGVAKSSVAVSAGGKSRIKTVEIAGEPAKLAALIETQIAKLR